MYGIEIELGYKNKIGDLNISANGSMAYLKNEVTLVDSDADFILGDVFQSMGTITRTAVGQSYNTFYGFKTNGIFQNEAEVSAYKNKDGGLIQPNARPGDFKWTDIDGDGKINDSDKTFLGNNLPKYTFGFTLNLDYHGFDLMLFTQGATGNKIFQIAQAGYRKLQFPN
ncbi:MAG: hypothetical protein IPJ13_17625 [Saprospiraceae bacterium]|nr:hypothetical protein [Saprospiraceae bacterium]